MQKQFKPVIAIIDSGMSSLNNCLKKLLIVLKITLIKEYSSFNPLDFNLNDKELLRKFDEIKVVDEKFVKNFGFNLLKAKFLLDNFIVHHSNEDDTIDNNPWKLQYWYFGQNKTNKCCIAQIYDYDANVQR